MASAADYLSQYGAPTDPGFINWLDSSGNSQQITQAMAGGPDYGEWDPGPWLNQWHTQYQNQLPAPAAPVAPKRDEAPTPGPTPGPTGGGGGTPPPAPAPVPAPTPVAAPAPSAPPPVAPQTGPAPAAGPSPLQQQSDALYSFLMDRAHQSQKIDPNDPMIRSQADNYNANLTRTGRQYLSQLAERKGAGGNIGAESRMVNEKNAQAGAAHEGELVQHESDLRRQEIEQALATAGQFMTAQQQMALQKELAQIDNNMKLYQSQVQQDQFGRTLGVNVDQFGRTLDLQNRTLTQQGDLTRLGISSSAGTANAALSEREREFAANLSQRAYEYDTDNTYRYSPASK